MIIQPFSYFGQPITAAGGFIVRPDVYASSVTIAIPGTQFGSTFGQTDYRSDISGFINGGTSLTNANLPLTGSGQTSSSTVKFASDSYTTSMAKGSAAANYGCIPGTSTPINFGSGAWTIECFYQGVSGTDNVSIAGQYNNGFGFINYSSEGYHRWVAQNASGAETLVDYAGDNPVNGTWNHIAFCRSGTTWYAALNGTIRGNLTLSGATGTTAAFILMNIFTNTGRPVLYQDFRVTKGVARYVGSTNSSYTVPQSIVTTA